MPTPVNSFSGIPQKTMAADSFLTLPVCMAVSATGIGLTLTVINTSISGSGRSTVFRQNHIDGKLNGLCQRHQLDIILSVINKQSSK